MTSSWGEPGSGEEVQSMWSGLVMVCFALGAEQSRGDGHRFVTKPPAAPSYLGSCLLTESEGSWEQRAALSGNDM